jgi:nucleoside-diphosphate-sugar epimerase
MRVLLAGATGAIGRHLVPQLIAAGHEVTGISRKPGSLIGTGASEIHADVSRRAALLATLDGREFDAVINELSSLHRTPLSYADMRETNRLRSEGTSTLIAAAKATGATRFVVASNVYGYGFRDHGRRLIDEEYPFGQLPGTALDAVQKSLLSAEQQARAFGGVALRYGLFYRNREPIPPVANDWNGLLPFVHIDDAAAATVLALDKGTPGRAYNVVDDEPVSWRDLHQARADAYDLADPSTQPTWLLRVAAPFGSQLVTNTSMRVSNARAKSELGWQLQYPTHRDAFSQGAELAHRAQRVLGSSR